MSGGDTGFGGMDGPPSRIRTWEDYKAPDAISAGKMSEWAQEQWKNYVEGYVVIDGEKKRLVFRVNAAAMYAVTLNSTTLYCGDKFYLAQLAYRQAAEGNPQEYS